MDKTKRREFSLIVTKGMSTVGASLIRALQAGIDIDTYDTDLSVPPCPLCDPNSDLNRTFAGLDEQAYLELEQLLDLVVTRHVDLDDIDPDVIFGEITDDDTEELFENLGYGFHHLKGE